MEFDKSRVYTALNAGELNVGDKVIVADTIRTLKTFVESDVSETPLVKIEEEDKELRFNIGPTYSGMDKYSLAYLVERAKEKKYRPYESIDEFVSDFIKRFNTNCPKYSMPFIWLRYKRDNHKRCITSFYVDNTVVSGGGFQTMEDLFNEFEFLDGTPCGKEIED